MFDNDPKDFFVTFIRNASQSLYPTKRIGAFTVELPQPIVLGPNDNWEVGLCEFSYPPNTVGIIKFINVVGDTTALVYCDEISPQYVAKSLVRCLRTSIYPTISVEHIYDYIYYLPVEKYTIKNIRIEILQLTGKRVECKSSKTPTRFGMLIKKPRHHLQRTFYTHGSPRAVLSPSGRSR